MNNNNVNKRNNGQTDILICRGRFAYTNLATSQLKFSHQPIEKWLWHTLYILFTFLYDTVSFIFNYFL